MGSVLVRAARALVGVLALVGVFFVLKVTTDAVQLLGCAGYVNYIPLERMMRDAKITTSTRARTRSSAWSWPGACSSSARLPARRSAASSR
jgi:hypothetical protein